MRVAVLGAGPLSYRTALGGLVPNGPRPVKPMPMDLKRLVPKPTDSIRVLKGNDPDPISDTVPMIMRLVRRQLWQGKKLAAALKGKSVAETVRNDWDFIHNYIQYEQDGADEQVRSLRRLVWDGRGDCDCYVTALSNLLLNQGIPHKLRVTKYNNSAEFSHIYIIVPQGSTYITLDCVPHIFNYEVPFTEKKDFDMKLSSLDGCPAYGPRSSSRLHGLGCGNDSAASAPVEVVTSSDSGATGPRKQLVSSQQLTQLGLMATSKVLEKMGLSFNQATDGTLLVNTASGPKIVGPLTKMEDEQKLIDSLTGTTTTPSTIDKPATSRLGTAVKIGAGVAVTALVLGAIRQLVATSTKSTVAPALAGVNRGSSKRVAPKRLATIHI